MKELGLFQAHFARCLDLQARLKVTFFYATVLLCLGSRVNGQNQVNFTITDFSKDMSLSGTCLVDNTTGILLMTAAQNGSATISASVDSACKAVYATKVRIYDPPTGQATSWNTSFTFTIQPQDGALPGEFMAFAITANKTVGTPLAAGLYDDNLLKPGGNPKIQVVAVRFFTYWNNVSLLINDKDDTAGRNWNLDKFNVSLNKAYDKMKTYQAWIDYDAVSKTMSFYIATQDGFATKSATSQVFSEYLDLSNSTRYAIVPSDSFIGFTAAVTADHREIHQVINWQFSHDQDSSNSSLVTTTDSSSHNSSTVNKGLIIGVPTAAGVLTFLLMLIIITFFVMRRAKVVASSHLDVVNFGPRRFKYSELRLATSNFSDDILLGKGGFGSVYKGTLENRLVAIKRISQNSTQGLREFEAEVLSIGRLRHRNLVTLLGWCHEQDELLLVYEYMANGSLDQHLYAKKGPNHGTLSWQSRFQILKSVAVVLDYLHNGWEQCILHRDIKPSNVMLDAEMNARLGDFGLARRAGHGDGHETTVMSHYTQVVGTVGYIAPVSHCYQAFTPKSDVYSFGVMALEVVCGRLPHAPVQEEENLVKWVWSMYKQGQVLAVVDSSLALETEEVVKEITRVLHLGMLCTLPDASLRPRTEKLLPALKGDWSLSLPASIQSTVPLPNSSLYSSSSSDPLVSDD